MLGLGVLIYTFLMPEGLWLRILLMVLFFGLSFWVALEPSKRKKRRAAQAAQHTSARLAGDAPAVHAPPRHLPPSPLPAVEDGVTIEQETFTFEVQEALQPELLKLRFHRPPFEDWDEYDVTLERDESAAVPMVHVLVGETRVGLVPAEYAADLLYAADNYEYEVTGVWLGNADPAGGADKQLAMRITLRF